MRTPEEVVMDVESELDYPLGPGITEVLEELVVQLDDRYEHGSPSITIEGTP
jgi:hypothetical protein